MTLARIRLVPLLLGIALASAPALPAMSPQASTGATAPLAPEKELAALLARFDAALGAYRDKLTALYAGFDEQTATDDERATLEKRRAEVEASDPAPAFVRDCAALAERAAGTEVAAACLLKVLEHDRTPRNQALVPGREALATLLEKHLQSPALVELPKILQYAPSIDSKGRAAAYARLASDAPIDTVQADALFALAMEHMAQARASGDLSKARERFVELKTRFGALQSSFGRPHAAIAEGFLYEIDHLQLGMQAPDFEATDQDGVKFKLSDYKGVVVVLDFWGFW